jgi:hypothetical protein
MAGLFLPAVGQGPLQAQLGVLDRRRLDQVIPDPALDGQFRAVRIPLARQDDDLRPGWRVFDDRQGLDAIAVRQADIEENDIEITPLQLLPSVAERLRAHAVVLHALHHAQHGLANLGVVVDDQNMRCFVHHPYSSSTSRIASDKIALL